MASLPPVPIRDKPYESRIGTIGGGGFLLSYFLNIVETGNQQGRNVGGVEMWCSYKGTSIPALEKQGYFYNIILEGPDASGTMQKDSIFVESLNRMYRRDEVNNMDALLNKGGPIILTSQTKDEGIYVPRNGVTLSDYENPNWILGDAKTTQGKYAYLALKRYAEGDQGKLYIIPTELTDANGTKIKKGMLELYRSADLDGMIELLDENTIVFANTLADRICTGRPSAEDAAECKKFVSFDDAAVTQAEPYGELVIEGETPELTQELREAFPVEGIHGVVFTDNLEAHFDRKIGLVNGGHSAGGPVAMYLGFEEVRQFANDPLGNAYMQLLLRQQAMAVHGRGRTSGVFSQQDLFSYADLTLARFRNPAIPHRWENIVNEQQATKTRVRNGDYLNHFSDEEPPRAILLGVAASLMSRRDMLLPGMGMGSDHPDFSSFIRKRLLDDFSMLPPETPEEITDLVADYYKHIPRKGMRAVVGSVLDHYSGVSL